MFKTHGIQVSKIKLFLLKRRFKRTSSFLIGCFVVLSFVKMFIFVWMKDLSKLFIASLIILAVATSVEAQPVEPEEVINVSKSFIDSYYRDYPRKIGDISTYGSEDETLIYIVNLIPEGWILVSGNKSAKPVMGFNYTDNFVFPEENTYNPAYNWIKQASEQIEELFVEPAGRADPLWTEGYEFNLSKADITVNPLISVEWGQGEGWNQLCPEDIDGPGGHALIGCVGVAMAQAMSVFELPDIGVGNISYEHDVYGTISTDYTQSEYRWDLMSDTEANEHSALFLYDCATSVEMDFGPDASSATTNLSPSAMATNFSMSWTARYLQRSGYTPEVWIEKMIYELKNGRPIIYKGRSDDGTSGHAFNVDGVVTGDLFHINWGWYGNNNGYFLIDDLTPGTRSYNMSQAAVFGIRPNATPVDKYRIDNELIIYPNPASSVLMLKNLPLESVISVKLFSINGALLKSLGATSITEGIDVSDMETGAYILEVALKDDRLIHKRIVKQ